MAERKEIQGWKPGRYGGYSRGSQEVDFDGDDLEVSQTVSGYEGYSSLVYVPLELIRVLIAEHELRQRTAPDVLEARVKELEQHLEQMTNDWRREQSEARALHECVNEAIALIDDEKPGAAIRCLRGMTDPSDTGQLRV